MSNNLIIWLENWKGKNWKIGDKEVCEQTYKADSMKSETCVLYLDTDQKASTMEKKPLTAKETND